MDQILPFLIIFIVALIFGFYLGNLISGLKFKNKLTVQEEKYNQLLVEIDRLNNLENKNLNDYKSSIENTKNDLLIKLAEVKTEREDIRKEKNFIQNELTRKNADYEHLLERQTEQKKELENLQEKFSIQFENLANKILENKSQKFTNLNKENIQNILSPLQEKIQLFEKRIEEGNKESIDRHAMLREQIIGLKDLNLQMSKEANNLTKALKGDTKMQGNWGEMILERVLEKSGLQKGREYSVQQSFTTEDGKRVLPDVVIHLPGDKKMIVDSKVSLNAYERYVNETEEDDKPAHLKNHLIAIKNRINELSRKNYHQLYDVESPDFVLLFIPIEAAFAVASNEYPNLYSEAFNKNIILVTPTTLLAVLRTIDSMWQNEKQKENAIEIATQAGKLYDQFTNLTEELLKVGKQLGTVQNSYDGAMKKLTGKGNLISRVEKLKKLGAKASKQIDDTLVKKSTILPDHHSEKNLGIFDESEEHS
ncbi:DNA recombination protein RmuC [Zunongwangia endophytica]|uniref:DNA recombination protein RmuC n=1 Tax=Zunongwangia endophytica TaxID=1808945 RepID=A0ABV8H767_9FLAO|nr:DNA recombination protein RmuC [Zunongwangia endophytica]MDN3593871.1 DNA recombination protein RmuC [Zunongwangia endophytica]